MKLIAIAHAQNASAQAATEAQNFVAKVNEVILYPFIYLLMGVAFLIFLWGCAEFVFGAANDQARAQGKKHVFWGIIGLVVMLSAMAILSIAAGTFGLGNALDCANGEGSGCDEEFMVPLPFGGGQTGGNTGGQTGGNTGGQTGGNTGGGEGQTGGNIPREPVR